MAAHQPLALATIHQLDPIYVDVPQATADLLRLQRRLKQGQLTHNGSDHAAVKCILQDGSDYPLTGRLEFREETIYFLLTARFWDGVPLPSVALDDPAHTSQETFWGLRRIWRGPSWVNAAWLVWTGLNRLGYADEAADLRDRLVAVVLRSGLREYYHPRSGAGMGARDFGWSTLIWEMMDPAP